jgi:hypothetical protein
VQISEGFMLFFNKRTQLKAPQESLTRTHNWKKTVLASRLRLA